MRHWAQLETFCGVGCLLTNFGLQRAQSCCSQLHLNDRSADEADINFNPNLERNPQSYDDSPNFMQFIIHSIQGSRFNRLLQKCQFANPGLIVRGIGFNLLGRSDNGRY